MVSAPDICERAKKGRQASGLEDKNKGKGKLDRGRTQIQEEHKYKKLQFHEKREHMKVSPVLSCMLLVTSILYQ
jgi:hypothetical protein